MTALTSVSGNEVAWERWDRLVNAVGARAVGAGQADMACPVHVGDNPRGFTIGVGERPYPLLACRTRCDMEEPGWLAMACAALVNLGAPPDALPPTASRSSRAYESRVDSVIGDEQAAEWELALWNNEQLRERLCDAWRINDDVLSAAEVGWDARQRRYAFPVRDERERVVQVIYRSLTAAPKSKTHKGVTGSHLYSPFALDDGVVLLLAGERDVFTARAAGWNAVTFTNGERSVPVTGALGLLSGRHVVVVYDNDAAGRAGSERAAAAVARVAASVAVADLAPYLRDGGKDVSDLLAQGDGADLLRQAVQVAEPRAAEPLSGPQPVDWQEFWRTDPEPIAYLVEPLFAQGEVTRLYAQAKVGKSLLVQECAAALAVGRRVLGQDPVATSVVYIDQENTWDDWKTRLADMGYGPGDDWSRFHWYSLQTWPALDTPAGGTALLDTVAQHSAGFVVIDTQSKVLEGEEDKAPTSAAFYRHTLLPLKRLGVAVVIIDHAGNDPAKPRGSSGKRDDVDVVWQVNPSSGQRLVLRRTHSRKRHEADVLTVERLLSPLRHEVVGSGAEDAPSYVDACVDAICALVPMPSFTTSAREVSRLLKEARGGKGFRDVTVRDAWKVVRGDA